MLMKKSFQTLFAAILCTLSLTGFAGNGTAPLWMRYPNISPDGQQIAFAYKGDIYTVPVKGGVAKQLTTAETFESQPIWSNDSKTIAFVSDRFGGMDIFMAMDRHILYRRWLSNPESPLFSASIQDPASSVLWASWMQEIYRVNVEGGRPYQVVASPICSISFDTDGKSFLYYDRTGSENIWRKHHVSSVARNISPPIRVKTVTLYLQARTEWYSSAKGTAAASTSMNLESMTLKMQNPLQTSKSIR